MTTAPWHPIIYVRGYAGTQAEVEDTVATPYMGFNLGATKLRQRWTGDIDRHIFESPLVRLMKDDGYTDVFDSGAEIPEQRRVAAKSVWIYRYYEPVSKDLGTGFRPEIEHYAKGLGEFIERVRNQVCGSAADASTNPDVQVARDAFKVYLVAHSMGGLVCRCYLQKIAPDAGVTPPVDKVFTYATPHGGIDFRLVGNVPGFLQFNNIENFNEKRMREYLGLPAGAPVTSLEGKFPEERFFCLVGTNSRDYTAGGGLSSKAVGPMSDGLVQIKNASVDRAPRSFVHRSHSGHYGIVNSEEGYQNLRRFLFGQVRVDGFLQVHDLKLPKKVEDARKEGKDIKASYHIEVVARVRGARWDLHRRTVGEESAVFADWDRITRDEPIRILSTFLLRGARVSSRRRSLGFSLDLGVQVPEYEIERRWLPDDHYEGGYIFRDKINLEVTINSGKEPTLKFGFDSKTPNAATQRAETRVLDDDRFEFRIPVRQNARPGIDAELVLQASRWS